MSQKPIIAVDIDDVIAFTADCWVAYSNNTWGTNYTTDDYEEDWLKVWAVNLEEGKQRAEMIHRSGTFGELRHDASAKSVLKHLSDTYRLIVVTSRSAIVRDETLTWLSQHFNGIFSDIKFTGFYDKSHKDAIKLTKASLLEDIGADYLIDDQLKHCLAAAEFGVVGLLFGDFKWNQIDTLPDNVIRVKNWREIKEYFDAKG